MSGVSEGNVLMLHVWLGNQRMQYGPPGYVTPPTLFDAHIAGLILGISSPPFPTQLML